MDNQPTYQVAYAKFVKPQTSRVINAAKPVKSIPPVRPRISFTTEQIENLEMEFRHCILLNKSRLMEIAKRLGLQEKQVKIWFQNRRVKFKKDALKGIQQPFEQINRSTLREIVPLSTNSEAGSAMKKIKNNPSVTLTKVSQKTPLLRVRKVEEINNAIQLELNAR